MISKGVMKEGEFKDSVFYQVGCSCGSKDCNMICELEYNEGALFLNLYKDVSLSVYWDDTNFFKRFWRRIKYATRMLFVGYVTLEESHILFSAFISSLE